MAVGTIKLFVKGKKNISLTSGIILGTTAMVAHLFKSSGASANALKVVSTYGSLKTVATEVTSGNNYKTSGKTLASVVWSSLGTNSIKFSSAAWVQTATGGNITSVKVLGIVATTGASTKTTANKVLCYCTLSTASFQISQNNTLTITPNASGLFYLT